MERLDEVESCWNEKSLSSESDVERYTKWKAAEVLWVCGAKESAVEEKITVESCGSVEDSRR